MLQLKTINYFIILLIIFGLIIGYLSTSGTKSQNIRLVDIFIIGPLMIYLGLYGIIKTNKDDKFDFDNMNNWLWLILILFGSTTISYNLKNYLVIYKK